MKRTPRRTSALARARRVEWAELVTDQLADGRRTPPGDGWTEAAACATQDQPDLWVPLDTQAPVSTRAAQVCDHCLVRADCLMAALVDEDALGVRAGVREADVSRLRNRYRRAQ